MTDKRKIEIIETTLKFIDNPYFMRNFNMDGGYGICWIVDIIRGQFQIPSELKISLTYSEITEFKEWMFLETIRRYNNGFLPYDEWIFKPGVIKPRINFLNKLLKKLENGIT